MSITQDVFAQLPRVDGRLTREVTNTGATKITNRLMAPAQRDIFQGVFHLATAQCFYLAVGRGALPALFDFGLGFRKMQL